MKGFFGRLFERIRKRSLLRGYACDHCGAELFDYPSHRLCRECEEKLYPVLRPCEKCGRESRAAGLCLDCKAQPPKFTKGISAFTYKGEGGLMVNRLKSGYPRLAAYFGEKMAERFLSEIGEDNFRQPLLIVAVPMTKERMTERGYNQAERLAESAYEHLAAKGISAELNFTLLAKNRETKLQKRATKKERFENVKGAYRLRKQTYCRGREILLIDDIMTTGATGSECAKKLINAGASKVYFLTATAVDEGK